jgi:hypothetical protein
VPNRRVFTTSSANLANAFATDYAVFLHLENFQLFGRRASPFSRLPIDQTDLSSAALPISEVINSLRQAALATSWKRQAEKITLPSLAMNRDGNGCLEI